MSLTVRCVHCGKAFQAREKHAGRLARCHNCGEVIPIASDPDPPNPRLPEDEPPRTSPDVHASPTLPVPASIVRTTPFDVSAPSANPYASPLATDARQQNVYITHTLPAQQTDAPGVISLIFGILALVLLVFGCVFSCAGGFVLYPIALLLAVAGLILGFVGRGNLRVAGITLNALVLVPVAIMFIMFVILALGGATSSIGP